MKRQFKIQRIYPYPIEEVWYAISEADELRLWLSPMLEGFALEAQHDFTIPFSWGFYKGVANCHVINIDPPLRLAYIWQTQNSNTLISWYLKEVAEGTALQFEQNGFEGWKGNFERTMIKRFWSQMLNKKLVAYLAESNRQ